tara:strand:+ start:1020 stop:1208 length:189 start_codon:yes stop_codon:yes gene_type:complete
MSLFEKIAFLESFFNLFKIVKIIHLNSEREIDQLLFDINEQIKVLEKLDAKHQIEKMPLFFN